MHGPNPLGAVCILGSYFLYCIRPSHLRKEPLEPKARFGGFLFAYLRRIAYIHSVPNDYLPLADAYGGLSGEQITYLEALKASNGNVTEASRACGIGVNRHYYWKRTDECYRSVLVHIADAAIDQIESALMAKAVQGDVPAATLLLKAWGRHRGYGDRVDLNVTDDTQRTYVVSYSTVSGPSNN